MFGVGMSESVRTGKPIVNLSGISGRACVSRTHYRLAFLHKTRAPRLSTRAIVNREKKLY